MGALYYGGNGVMAYLTIMSSRRVLKPTGSLDLTRILPSVRPPSQATAHNETILLR